MIRKISLIVVLLWNSILFAQTQKLVNQEIRAISTKDYESFKASSEALIMPMRSKRIVGLGEGTHGTSEFYQVRAWISRLLIEEGGFNCIAFENDLSDGFWLDKGLSEGKDLDSLMRTHLLAIWQNEEVKEMLTWIRRYNETHEKKVMISGIDYVMLQPDWTLLQDLLNNSDGAVVVKLLSALKKSVHFQDEVWAGMNKKGFHYDRDSLLQNGYQGYRLAEQLEKHIQRKQLSEQNRAQALLVVLNIKQAFAPFYHAVTKTREISRDENMAITAAKLLEDKAIKMIIWAHNGHVAKKGIYNNRVGGMGGHLMRLFPNEYFVLGSGTAFGTFAATTDPRDTYSNKMEPYALEKPIKGSWEAVLATATDTSLYFFPHLFNPSGTFRPLRFIGYNPNSGKDTYEETNLVDLFDAFLFIRNTHAAKPIADK